MKKHVTFLVCLATSLMITWACFADSTQQEKTAPPKPGPAGKYSIKEIMQKGFKTDGNLKELIIDGKATTTQKDQFIDYAENLAKYKVRKGEQADFEMLVADLVTAAKSKNLKGFEKAASCKACHKAHKIYPPKKK